MPPPLRARIAEMTQQFCDARPTFDFRGLESFFDEWFVRLPAGAAAGETIGRQAREFGQQIMHARQAPGAPGGCHIAESGAVVDALQRER